MKPRPTQHATRNTFHVSRFTFHVSRLSPPDWNSTLSTLPTPHVLQTWEWGEFKSRYGWRPARYLWLEGEHPRAAASLLTRRLGRLPLAVAYVPKGPVLDYGDAALLDQVLSDLEHTARQARALFVKIDPDVRAGTAAGNGVVELLRRRGWRPSREQVQFRNTVLLDLTRSSDDMLAAMKQKWRYNVRLAARQGVTARLGTPADLPLLYDLYAETAARDGFVIRPREYYRDAWGAFIEAGLAQPLIAEVAGEAVAMVIVFRLAGRAWYMYGASRSAHRDKMPNHLLQWEAMRWARARGCTEYDLWGVPDEDEATLEANFETRHDDLWGVYRFKRGFGGQLRRSVGAWERVYIPVLYALYRRLV